MKFRGPLERDPVRLGEQDAGLQRALVALQESHAPSSDELRRVHQRLSVVFQSPVPEHGMLLRLARGPAGSVFAGVVFVAAAVAILRVQPPHATVVEKPALAPQTSVASVRSHADSLPTTAPAEPQPSLPSPVPRAEPSSAAKTQRSHAHLKARAPQRAPEPRTMSEASTSRVEGSPSSGTVAPASRSSGAAPAASYPTPNAAPAVPTPSTQAPSTPTAPLAPVAPTKTAAVASPLDEATLLERARKLASSSPDTSLRLLDEHKHRFAHGMLGPEREVFAIKLLHAMSRNDEAAQRLQAFRRTYPDSVYLNRLER